MEISINYLLIVISLLFFVVAYLVGIKKQTWMLAGFNEARIRDKDRLARIAGYFFLNSGLFILLNSFISFQGQELTDSAAYFGIWCRGYYLCE